MAAWYWQLTQGNCDRRARHEEVLRAKTRRDQQAAPLRAALQELRLQGSEETAGDSEPSRTMLPRIKSAERGLQAPQQISGAKASSKSRFREVMEEIRDVKRARSSMLDPFVADLKVRLNE